MIPRATTDLRPIAGLLLVLIISGSFGGIAGTAPNHPPIVFWQTPTGGIPGGGNVVPGGSIPRPNWTPTATTNQQNSVALKHGNNYCTGVSSGPWSPTVSGDSLILVGNYPLKSLNVTGVTMLVTVVLGANGVVPSTTFASGTCASLAGASTFQFTVYSATSNIFYTGSFAFSTTRATGTYYAWLYLNVLSVDVLAQFGILLQSLQIGDITNDKVLAGASIGGTDQGTWPLFPSAVTEAPATQAFRQRDLLQSQTTQARLTVRIVASAGSSFTDPICGGVGCAPIWPQYSTDGGTTWHDLCGDATETPMIDITQAPSVTPYSSPFCTIQSGAFGGSILLRIVGDGGDDATQAQLSLIEVELSP